MNTMQWMVVGFSTLTSAAIGAGAARWWAGRRTAELLSRLDRLEKARQVATQHSAQARRQIEQLQKEIAAQYKARAEARSARKRELNDSLDAHEQTIRIERPAADVGVERPALPAHGFADTLPMS